jgi:hypothetical protein
MDPLQRILFGQGEKVITVVREQGVSLVPGVIALLSV